MAKHYKDGKRAYKKEDKANRKFDRMVNKSVPKSKARINKNTQKKSVERNKTKIFLTLLEIIFIIGIIISGVNIYKWITENKQNSEINNKIEQAISIDNTGNGDSYMVDFKILKEQNADTIAWIKVNGTNIEYPVVKACNNDYYLNHSFDKSYNSAGWVYANYTSNFDNTDKNIVIFGHNRRDGSMFGSLKNILKDSWYNNDQNRNITLLTENENSVYRVFSVYQILKEDYYIKTDFKEGEYTDFIKCIKERSIKNFEEEVNENDQILTLSTCANNNKYRVVLHAYKVNNK